MNIDLSLDSVLVRVNGREIEFYPLNFRALRQLGNELEELRKPSAGITPERFDAICRVLVASANRKKQVLTEEEALDLFDPAWADQILEAVSKLSGMRRTQEPGQFPVPGTVNTAVPTSPQIGGASTPQ